MQSFFYLMVILHYRLVLLSFKRTHYFLLSEREREQFSSNILRWTKLREILFCDKNKDSNFLTRFFKWRQLAQKSTIILPMSALLKNKLAVFLVEPTSFPAKCVIFSNPKLILFRNIKLIYFFFEKRKLTFFRAKKQFTRQFSMQIKLVGLRKRI